MHRNKRTFLLAVEVFYCPNNLEVLVKWAEVVSTNLNFMVAAITYLVTCTRMFGQINVNLYMYHCQRTAFHKLTTHTSSTNKYSRDYGLYGLASFPYSFSLFTSYVTHGDHTPLHLYADLNS